MDEKPNLHNTGDWRQYSVEDGAQHQSETQANNDKETTSTPGEDESPKTPSNSCQKNSESIHDSEIESSPEKFVPKGADRPNLDDPNSTSKKKLSTSATRRFQQPNGFLWVFVLGIVFAFVVLVAVVLSLPPKQLGNLKIKYFYLIVHINIYIYVDLNCILLIF